MSYEKHQVYHSPKWYYAHCRAENGGSPIFRMMLKNDMKFIDADIDTHLTYQERIESYEEKWNAIIKGEILHEPGGGVFRSDVLRNELMEVIERESMAGFRPSDQFKVDPFKTIDELMTEAGLNENVMREFLKWRSRRGALAKREEIQIQEPASKIEAREKLRRAMKRNPFFE
jgi:hypothetical protein